MKATEFGDALVRISRYLKAASLILIISPVVMAACAPIYYLQTSIVPLLAVAILVAPLFWIAGVFHQIIGHSYLYKEHPEWFTNHAIIENLKVYDLTLRRAATSELVREYSILMEEMLQARAAGDEQEEDRLLDAMDEVWYEMVPAETRYIEHKRKLELTKCKEAA